MGVTKEQIEQARKMDLLTYLRIYEPDELVKVGSSYATKTHGSLRVNENGLWNWFSRGVGGKTALDYLIKVQGMDFVAAVHHLCGTEQYVPVADVKNVVQEKKEFILPDRSKNMRALYGYLQARGIPREIISECVRRKILFQTSSHGHNNCVFVGMNEKGVPKYASVRGCSGGFRMDIEGSEKKYGFSLLSENKDCRVVAAFEAPIDAMSGAAIAYLKNGDRWKSMHYLSLGGLNYGPLDHFLELHPQVKTVCLCADQDQRGREFTQRMMERYTAKGIKILDKPPKIGKDYNVRLSVEKEIDESLQVQTLMLHEFIREQEDLELAETYVDNGFTGTNFDRPGFVRLMDDVRQGRIQCIVVKDLSRLGRNFLETGYYIETLLPRLNVRLLSINDQFDSFREGDINNISVPIKNMINELYAKDISRKVTAYNDLHRQRGDVKLLRTVYGYKIDTERNIYIANPDTAPVVQMIFRWYLMGISTGNISDRLNRMQIITPLKYKTVVESGGELTKKDEWDSNRIMVILHNSIYIGDLVWGKRRKTLYQNQPEHKTPEQEWVVWNNMHEPLVSRADYNEAQIMAKLQLKKKIRKGTISGKLDPLQGMVYCAGCGCRMKHMDNYRKERDGRFYFCDCQVNDESSSQYGHRFKIHADFLRIVVADEIHALIKYLCDNKKLVSEMYGEMQRKGGLPQMRRRKQQIKREQQHINAQIDRLYENFADGILDTDDFHKIKEKYDEKKQECCQRLQEVERECRITEQNLEEFLEKEKSMETYLDTAGLNDYVIHELVDRIFISQDNGVEIRFKCKDVIEQVALLRKEGAEEW